MPSYCMLIQDAVLPVHAPAALKLSIAGLVVDALVSGRSGVVSSVEPMS